MSADYTFKVLMLGEASVGKTTLTHKYIRGIFIDNPRLTIGVDFFTKKIRINDKKISLQIWDFGGEERFRFLLPTYTKGSNAAYFLYDITSKNSLDSIGDWLEIVRENAGNIPIILVGTKLDLEEYRQVDYSYAEKIKEKFALAGHIEVSAKTGKNIEESFKMMVKILMKQIGALH